MPVKVFESIEALDIVKSNRTTENTAAKGFTFGDAIRLVGDGATDAKDACEALLHRHTRLLEMFVLGHSGHKSAPEQVARS